MSLQAVYQQFLAAPDSSLLASDASLHYITTLVTYNSSEEIIKHLNGQSRELKKLEEKFLDVVEGANSIAVEVYSTIEFLAGGGSYLPGLDDNFVADHTVTIPIIHIVSFNGKGKIQQIRQSWDQGALLKLIDVIGKNGRNWPIRDGKDQIKLIVSSIKSAGHNASPENGQSKITRSHEPHASLSLFAARDRSVNDTLPPVVAPRSSAAPPQRNYHDLFVGYDSDPSSPGRTPVPQHRSESPQRAEATKAGAGRNFPPSRLFDKDEAEEEETHEMATEKSYRPNPTRYNHFDITGGEGESEEHQRPEKEVKASKHGSQWNFDDFMTPQKIIPGKVLRTNDVRHWGNSDDEVIDSPVKAKKVDKPRKDAEPHFEFEDDGTPEGVRVVGRPRGQGANTGQGLYKNNLYDDETGDAPAATAGQKAPKSISNVGDRKKIFDPHFQFTDNSPTTATAPRSASEATEQPLRSDRAKAVKMMDANWDSYDQSPVSKENARPVGIRTDGDGMGGKKGVLSEATNNSSRNDPPKGILTMGNGMGGKKGTARSWGFGDESDGEEAGGINQPAKFRTGKTQGKPQATGGDFWDF